MEDLRDTIPNWIELVNYCKTFERDYYLKMDEEVLKIFKRSGEPPEVEFSVFLHSDYRIEAYRRRKKIVLRNIIDGFSNRVKRYSQIDSIIDRLKTTPIDSGSELQNMGNQILNLCSFNNDEKRKRQLSFIGKQLLALESKPHGRRYSAEGMMEAIDLYLQSRNTYRALRELLALPTRNNIYKYFGKLGLAGSQEDSNKTVKNVFEALNEKQRQWYISFDEVHIKPGFHYQGKYVLGNAMNTDTDCPAMTMLGFMVNPCFGAPAFIARMIPVHNLEAEFLYDQLLLLINSIHEAGGYVFALMSDNLKLNQKCFKMFHKSFPSLNIFSVSHPFLNIKFSALFLIYDPTHLFKNIRNNWVTEKTQTLDFSCPDTGVEVSAKWKDLITIYKNDNEGGLTTSKLDYQTLHLNNFENQKVHLVVNVFNEKTCVILSQRKMNDTHVFVEKVMKMWHIMNIKVSNAASNLNDRNRDVIRDPNDNRLVFLDKIATSFKKMDNSVVGHRVRGLTADTSNALYVTLTGFVELIKTLLLTDHQYVMPGKIQSDRIEGEYGILRGSCGGNHTMSAEQVSSGLQLQRLKLYAKLDVRMEDSDDNVFCKDGLVDSEENLDLVERCFKEASCLSVNEKSTLFYMSSYVACQEGITCSTENTSDLPESEFTEKLSRGKLSFPPNDLYDLSQYLYSFFKLRKNKCCTKYI